MTRLLISGLYSFFNCGMNDIVVGLWHITEGGIPVPGKLPALTTEWILTEQEMKEG